MNEQNMAKLIETINNLGQFSWGDFISLVALIGSWITIILLLLDRHEQNRPYLQITFELVRSNLTCVVIRNVGKTPLILKNITFDKEFVNQLPERERKYLINSKINNLKIFPGKQWIICLGVIVPEILENYEKKTLNIDYTYQKIKGFKKYKENTQIDFEQYSRFLVYISEIDELSKVNEKIEKNTRNIDKKLKNIEASIVQYNNIQDKYISTIVNGYKKIDK